MNMDMHTLSNSTLADSTDDTTSRVMEKKTSRPLRQVDFYRNPTVLSRLILNEKFASALKRVKNHPEEASTWVCSKRNPFKGKDVQAYYRSRHNSLSSWSSMRRLNSKLDPKLLDYTIRQLPIHMACSSLFRATLNQRTDLEILITHLAVMYPEGCEQPDQEGKLPLHEAIWHNAAPETISVLLMASPNTLHERDKFGRAPLELNRFRSGDDTKEQIKDMLLRGVAYWESAREEALSRTKNKGDDTKGEGILRNISLRLQAKDLVEPVTWSKLEQRAIYLEKLLSSLYEKNYALGEIVETLQGEKMEHENTRDRVQKATGFNDSERSVPDLMEENENLRREIVNLQEQLTEKEKSSSSEKQFDIDAVQYLEWRNASLQFELDAMTQRNREKELKLDRLDIVVDSLRKKVKARERDYQRHFTSSDTTADNMDSYWKDFMDLLELLTSQSPLVMERFLSSRIIDLEDQLADANRMTELYNVTTTEENRRLLQENKTLQDRVETLSSRQIRPPTKDMLKRQVRINPVAPQKSAMQKKILPQSENPYSTDSLNEILRQAASMYTTEASELQGQAIARGGNESDILSGAPDFFQDGRAQGDGIVLAGTFPPDVFYNTGNDVPNAKPAEIILEDNRSAMSLSVTSAPGVVKGEWRETHATALASVPYDEQLLASAQSRNLATGVYKDRQVSEKQLTVSDISMDSLSRIRTLSSSNGSSGLRSIPTDVIVALRTASFSTTNAGDIEKILQDADAVLGEPIPEDVKQLIRDRFRREGADLSKLLLAWLAENLGDSDGTSLSAEDLDVIFKGADQRIAAPTSDIELPPTSSLKSDNSFAAAFRDTARYTIERQLFSQPSARPASASLASSSTFEQQVAENLGDFNEAARAYARPILIPPAVSAQDEEFSYGQFNTRSRSRNTPTARKEPLDELFKGYKLE